MKIKEKKIIYSFETEIEDKKFDIVVRKPSRLEIEGVKSFSSIQYGKYIREGYVPKALIQNKIDKEGEGIIPENKIKEYQEKITSLSHKTFEYVKLESKDEKNETDIERIEELRNEVVILELEIQQFSDGYSEVFSHTAEYRAEIDFIYKLVYDFSYFAEVVVEKEKGEDDELVEDKEVEIDYYPIFNGEDFVAKKEYHDQILEYIEEREEDPEHKLPSGFKDAKLFVRRANLVRQNINKLARILMIYNNDPSVSKHDIGQMLEKSDPVA